MTTAVKIGLTATVKMANASAVLTSLGEVIEISIPNPQVDDVEATHFGSTAKEYIAGMTDNGEISFGFNYIGGSATDLLITAAIADRVTRAFEVIVPSATDVDGWKFSFNGVVKGYEKTIPIGDRQTATMTVRVTGGVTEVAA